jgi:hypothetical protein
MNDLTHIWTKSNCLTKGQLLSYIQHQMDREEEYLVESHLNDCPLCNDALEGMMNEDLEQIEKTLSELKSKFDHRLSELKKVEIEKTNPSQKSSATSKPHDNSSNLKIISKRRYRWVYAASILLIIGLGYSVFSFIKNYDKKPGLAHQKEDPQFKPNSPKYTPIQDSSLELAHLEANEEDINQLRDKKELSIPELPSTKAIASNSPSSESKVTESKPSMQAVKEVEAKQDNASASIPTEKPSEANQSSNMEADNLNSFKKEDMSAADQKISPSKKSNGYGMTKNANAPQLQSNATNQLNYSSNSNSANDVLAKNNVSQAKNKKTLDGLGREDEIENTIHAIDLFEKGNYKRAVKQFEKLLPNTSAAQKEEVLYYLGMSYLRLDNTSKAKIYLSQLCKSTKYAKVAAPYCADNIQQTMPTKK